MMNKYDYYIQYNDDKYPPGEILNSNFLGQYLIIIMFGSFGTEWNEYTEL